LNQSKKLLKKSQLKSNGSYPVEVKTVNGNFIFNLFRFKGENGSSNYFRESGIFVNSSREKSSYESEKLKNFASYYATKLSYENVSELLKERTGNNSISDQRVQQIVIEKSVKIGKNQAEMIDKSKDLPMPILEKGDLYDSLSEEVVWLEDGVCVSQQKEKRNKVPKKGKERTTTDMILLEKETGSFEYIVAANGISLTALSRAKLKGNYSGKSINLVAISDGSRTIKNRSIELFGEQYWHILDWYHLQKKVKDLMSMIAPNKELKSQYVAELTGLLWYGNIKETLCKLEKYQTKTSLNGIEKYQELLDYLKKNQPYIIDYAKRKDAGKTIGSGRMEKAVDCIVARRQKEKAMSWSKKGSTALAVVTAQVVNDRFTTENLH
jgi:hypothetical protein